MHAPLSTITPLLLLAFCDAGAAEQRPDPPIAPALPASSTAETLDPAWTVARDASLAERGAALAIEAQPGAVIEAHAPLDWAGIGALELQLHSEREATVELLLAQEDRSAWFWRRVDLASGSNTLELPLAWFRWSDGTSVPAWSEVDRIELRFRDQAEVSLGGVAVVAGSPLLGPPQLSSISEAPLELLETPAVTLLWGAPALETEQLAERLSLVHEQLSTMMPWLPEPPQPPTLVILRDRAAYRHYAVRLALGFDADLSFPGSDGFTLQGVGLGYWDPTHGSLRPSYTHEYVHAWLASHARLPSDRSDWFHEGMASLVQLRFHP